MNSKRESHNDMHTIISYAYNKKVEMQFRYIIQRRPEMRICLLLLLVFHDTNLTSRNFVDSYS